MTVPSVTPLPTAPSRSRPDTFATEADAFLGALDTFGTEVNALGDAVETSTAAAAVSETNAAASASAASTSESNASASAAAAAIDAASVDELSDIILGAKASDPTLDNDGDPLQEGAIYYNTTVDQLRVYSNGAWVTAAVDINGALLQANNLSDLTNAATARTNLGVAVGTDVLAYDANLQGFVTAFNLPTTDGTAGQILSTDGSGNLTLADPSGGGVAAFQEFTASGTWTKDPDASFAYVECLGAGGSGGRASTSSFNRSMGGGGGDFAYQIYRTQDLPATVSVTVGSGGAGVSGISSGIDGGDTQFGSLILARGGRGGLQGLPPGTNALNRKISGGASTSADARIGGMSGVEQYILACNTGIMGGLANDIIQLGADPGISVYGGGAGRGYPDGTTVRVGSTSEFAGNGGNSGTNSVAATSGQYPAGGGGAANPNNAAPSGAGANGRVRVWQW